MKKIWILFFIFAISTMLLPTSRYSNAQDKSSNLISKSSVGPFKPTTNYSAEDPNPYHVLACWLSVQNGSYRLIDFSPYQPIQDNIICPKSEHEGYQMVALLQGMIVLSLNNNEFTELPAEIGYLTTLRHLDLVHNQLVSLPPEIGQLVNLEGLNVGYNQLIDISSEIGNLNHLGILQLQNNQLLGLPSEIG